jgi:uncharacterized protein
MREQDNIDVVRDSFNAFLQGDIPTVLESLTEDVVWHVPGADGVPIAGTFKGRAGVADFFRKLAENEDIQTLDPQQFLADRDTVVVLGRYRSTVRSTGHTIDEPWVMVFTLEGGRVQRFDEYFDTAHTARAYGAVEVRA